MAKRPIETSLLNEAGGEFVWENAWPNPLNSKLCDFEKTYTLFPQSLLISSKNVQNPYLVLDQKENTPIMSGHAVQKLHSILIRAARLISYI